MGPMRIRHTARPSATLLFAIITAGSCGGASPSAPGPTVNANHFNLSIAVAVMNVKFGTGRPEDVVITVSGGTAPISFMPIDETPTTIAWPNGTPFTVNVTGPAGYDINRSVQCSGAGEPAPTTCQVVLKELPVTCDDSLWGRVYLRDRLRVLDACQAASGIVADVGVEPDGDLVMEIIPDAPYAGLLRPGNRTNPDAHNHLVVEVPCQGPTTETDASAACAHFTGQKVPIPSLGAHIVAAAHWVEDRNHSSWGELHGARIVPLPR